MWYIHQHIHYMSANRHNSLQTKCGSGQSGNSNEPGQKALKKHQKKKFQKAI